MDTSAARPALYSTRTRTVLRFYSSIVARRGTRWVACRTYVLTVLYCCAHLLNYTVPVPCRTVRYIGPSSSACTSRGRGTSTTVLHSYRTLLQTLFSVLVVGNRRRIVPYQYADVDLLENQQRTFNSMSCTTAQGKLYSPKHGYAKCAQENRRSGLTSTR